MFEFEDDNNDSSVSFGSSPPNRPFVAEGSDLFRSVMDDLRQDNKLTHAVVDVRSKADRDKTYREEEHKVRRNYVCKRCLSDTDLCRCVQDNSKCAINRVQWIDELYDKPIAVEKTITDSPLEGILAPKTRDSDNVKPILKHRATCIIIVSE